MLSNNILPIHIWDLPQNGQPIHSVVTIQYETRKYGVLFIAKWVKEYVVMETDKAVQYYLYSNPCVPSEAVCHVGKTQSGRDHRASIALRLDREKCVIVRRPLTFSEHSAFFLLYFTSGYDAVDYSIYNGTRRFIGRLTVKTALFRSRRELSPTELCKGVYRGKPKAIIH